VKETGSDQLYQILQDATELALCVILVPEITSGLNRRKREGSLSLENYNLAKKQLLNDVRDATILQITPAVVLQSIKLLEANALRAMDALHIACALEWQADLYITSDKNKFEAAVNTGISSELVGQQVH
jgi:uncharacterized protein